MLIDNVDDLARAIDASKPGDAIEVIPSVILAYVDRERVKHLNPFTGKISLHEHSQVERLERQVERLIGVLARVVR